MTLDDNVAACSSTNKKKLAQLARLGSIWQRCHSAPHSVLRVARKVETILTMNHSSSLNDCENVLFFCTPSSRARAKQIATKITHKDRNFDMRREKKNRLVWQLSDVEKSSSCDDKSPLRSNILQFAFLAFDLLKRNKKKLFARLLALFVHSLFDYHDTTSDSRVSIWLLFLCALFALRRMMKISESSAQANDVADGVGCGSYSRCANILIAKV